MSIQAEIIDLLDNATKNSLEKILGILKAEKGNKNYTLKEICAKGKPLAEKYSLTKMILFGSYARGTADAQSDLDFYCEGGNFRGLEYTKFVDELEEKFKCHVDLISDENFLPNERIVVYEK